MKVNDIDPDGDVVLMCGKEEEQKSLRVCSTILSKASPVLKALLSPRYSEGTELRTNGTVEIKLPDDDAIALETVCYALHFRYDKIDPKLTARCVGDVARLAEKYDPRSALRPVAELWISKHMQEYPGWSRRVLLGAAYCFQHGEVFEQVANEILWQVTPLEIEVQLLDGSSEETGDLHEVFDRLNTQRKHITERVSSEIDAVLSEEAQLREKYRGYCPDWCQYAEKRLFWILTCLRKKSLWPISELKKLPLSLMVKHLQVSGLNIGEDLNGGSQIPKCNSARCVIGHAKGFDDVDRVLFALAAAISRDIIEVCYRCVREGRALSGDCAHKWEGGKGESVK